MNANPSVLIVSSSNTRPKSLIKLITKTSNPTEDSNDSNILFQPWTIQTKYYTAEINLIGINENYKRSQQFNDNVEALIIHIDTNKESGLDDLSVWSNIAEECEPEIKLLIANYCNNDTKITKQQATEWCLKNGFEFIELYPNVKPEPDQDIIEEKIGVERIVEALQTHTWSNLKMLSNSEQSKSGDFHEELNDDDDFSELFSQLSMMKDSLQSLPASQRKQCAEQVVTAFWRAIGGDEDEIADV